MTNGECLDKLRAKDSDGEYILNIKEAMELLDDLKVECYADGIRGYLKNVKEIEDTVSSLQKSIKNIFKESKNENV
jgi:hypothetical protein